MNRVAFSATAHCLTGCAIGEVPGMVMGTALGWGEAANTFWRDSPALSATR